MIMQFDEGCRAANTAFMTSFNIKKNILFSLTVSVRLTPSTELLPKTPSHCLPPHFRAFQSISSPSLQNIKSF